LKQETKKSLIRLGIVLGIIFGTIGGFYGISVLVLGTPMPYSVVMSGSMKPVLNEGDIIIISAREADPGEIVVGDIIVFWAKSWGASDPGVPIVHRVVNVQYISGYWYTTEGDNNPGPDSWDTSHANVIGKVIQILPYLGFLAYYVNTAGGTWLIYLLIGITIIALVYLTLKGDDKEEDKEEKSKD